jgi:hypothetical protein
VLKTSARGFTHLETSSQGGSQASDFQQQGKPLVASLLSLLAPQPPSSAHDPDVVGFRALLLASVVTRALKECPQLPCPALVQNRPSRGTRRKSQTLNMSMYTVIYNFIIELHDNLQLLYNIYYYI